jgi:hypothetical protein
VECGGQAVQIFPDFWSNVSDLVFKYGRIMQMPDGPLGRPYQNIQSRVAHGGYLEMTSGITKLGEGRI